MLAALYIDGIETHQVAGPSTRIDLTGIQFSAPLPSGGTTWAPHLVVLVHCPAGHEGFSALEVVFVDQDDTEEELARSVQPLQIEPGRFKYQLVRAEIPVAEPCTITARCRIDQGPVLEVPFNHLPAVE